VLEDVEGARARAVLLELLEQEGQHIVRVDARDDLEAAQQLVAVLGIVRVVRVDRHARHRVKHLEDLLPGNSGSSARDHTKCTIKAGEQRDYVGPLCTPNVHGTCCAIVL